MIEFDAIAIDLTYMLIYFAGGVLSVYMAIFLLITLVDLLVSIVQITRS